MEFQFAFANPIKKNRKKGASMRQRASVSGTKGRKVGAKRRRVKSRSTKGNKSKMTQTFKFLGNPFQTVFKWDGKTKNRSGNDPKSNKKIGQIVQLYDAEIKAYKDAGNQLDTFDSKSKKVKQKALTQIKKIGKDIKKAEQRVQTMSYSETATDAQKKQARDRVAELKKKQSGYKQVLEALKRERAKINKFAKKARQEEGKLASEKSKIQKELNSMAKQGFYPSGTQGPNTSGAIAKDAGEVVKKSLKAIDTAEKAVDKARSPKSSKGKKKVAKKKKTAKKKTAKKKTTKKKTTKKKTAKKKTAKKKVGKKKATKKKVAKKKVVRRKKAKKKVARRKKTTKKKTAKKKTTKKKVGKKKATKKKVAKKATKKKTTKRKRKATKTKVSYQRMQDVRGFLSKVTKRKTKGGKKNRAYLAKKGSKASVGLLKGGQKGSKKREKFTISVIKNPIFGGTMANELTLASIPGLGNQAWAEKISINYSTVESAALLGGGFFQPFVVKGFDAVWDMTGLPDLLGKAGAFKGSLVAILAGALFNMSKNEYSQAVAKGLSASGLVSAGYIMAQLATGSSTSTVEGVDFTAMSGVDYTPMSGVDFTPMSGVDFTPMSGVDYTPMSEMSPLGFEEGSADFGAEESPADFGAEESPADFGAEESPADFGMFDDY